MTIMGYNSITGIEEFKKSDWIKEKNYGRKYGKNPRRMDEENYERK